ncbi:hypothetical protein KY290_037009 [Solanum tuberosum]|uniref:Uncharacterized protein n=1 Tax=Solanum tuberosum TaxID=4113 RepID=A0ABQ7TW61_SOLTU|nr:hypothetical protein KY290_037009 [Solanum tuberosum]
MSNSSSPSKYPLSQEIENPNSFNFSIPLPEGSPSTLVLGLVRLMNLSHPIMKYKYSQNSEAQSVVKPTLKTPTKDLEVVSQRGHVSSTMSERLFEGDLPEGKGMESNILATTKELVVVQSLASLIRDTQPMLLEKECRSPERVHHSVQPVFDQTLETIGFTSEEEDEEETPLVWSRKGVRGENASTMVIPNLGETEVVPETRIENEHTESEKKRKRKGKGKMVESPTKVDRKRYTTRGVVQKLLGDALVANEVQIERN